MNVRSSWLSNRLRNRADSEHEQAIVRLVIASLIFAYFWFLYSSAASPPEHIRLGVLVMLAESLIGLMLFGLILARPAPSHARRWVGMIADNATPAILMSLSPATMAPLYIIMMWVAIGNGLRYGIRYLVASSLVSAVAFLAVITIEPYWRQQPYLAWGLWVGLIAIPLYLSSLLKKLRSAIDEARRANAAKSRFLANMSHEFRSPLNGIIGMSELLHSTRLAAEQKEYAEVIQAAAQTLLLLVDDVLDISAIEAGKLQRKQVEFNLHDLVHRLQKMLQPQAAEKRLSLTVGIDEDVPLRLYGDSAHLTQILLNLLHNALKFTDAGSVALKVMSQGRRGDTIRLRFSVRDTGIGIPDEDKERIFRPFEQVDSGLARQHGGTGLGTTIAQTLTNLLGGEIGLEDNPGGGSHFWAELPMQVPQAPSAAEDQSTVVSFEDPFLRHKARVRPVHVLVADDQAANRKVLCRMLERAGHRVSEADDGEQALDRIAEGGIDIAIIDMHMPRVTGLDVLKQLRFMQAGSKRTPVIVFSADATPQALRDAEEAGAHAFLTKPVVVARLLEAVASLLDGRKLTTAKPAAEGVRPMVNPVVLQELAEMNLGGAFLRDFVEQCLADANQCVIEMNRLHSLQDWREFREMAHALKGVAENLGAQMLADRCSQVMRASDEALRREASVLIRDITVQLGSAAEQTRAEAARLSAGTGKPDADAGPERSPGPDKG